MDLLDDIMPGAGVSRAPTVTATFIKTPFKPVVPKTQPGSQKQASGIEVQASMTRMS